MDKSTQESQAGTEWLTVSEYARRYRVSEQTVRNLCRTGKLPAVKVGRLFRIPNKTTEK
jgi:excisionase family DNA binding protein